MPDSKKYYYIKLKDNYFDQDSIKILESQVNGHTYSLILIKLYLKACRYNGQIKMNHYIPYSANEKDIEILSKVINHDKDHVKEALKFALDFGIISIVNQKEIWLTEMQNFIGQSSTEADRIREYRKRIESVQMYDNRTPEIEIEIEIDKEKEIDIKKRKRFVKPTLNQLEEYLEEKKITEFTAEDFWHYYESIGWVIGKDKKPMKSWKSSVYTFLKNHKRFNPKQETGSEQIARLKREGRL